MRHGARAGHTVGAEKNPAGWQGALLHLPDAGARERPRGEARQMSAVRDDAHSGDVKIRNAGSETGSKIFLSDAPGRGFRSTGQVSEMRNGSGAVGKMTND